MNLEDVLAIFGIFGVMGVLLWKVWGIFSLWNLKGKKPRNIDRQRIVVEILASGFFWLMSFASAMSLLNNLGAFLLLLSSGIFLINVALTVLEIMIITGKTFYEVFF